MAKEKDITAYCCEATITSAAPHLVRVEMEAVNIGNLLTGLDTEEVDNWIRANRDPEGIFSTTELEKWAEANGYVKDENK